MRRQTYREGVKAHKREQKHKRQSKKRLVDQDTATFDREQFMDTSLAQTTDDLQTESTTEVFYEQQKRRQWFWSGEKDSGRRFLVIILIVVAILLVIWLLPGVIELLF
ncbi:MAG: hypothetical protein MR008_02420 [Aerococcus sp.]|nr:hypothetical protein [Aerococcus sp.]